MKKLSFILLCFFVIFSWLDMPYTYAYQGYPNLEEMYKEIYKLQEQSPELVQVIEFGKSIQGRPLLYIRIALPDKENKENRPQAMIAANIHGNEWIGNRVAMAIAQRLIESNKDNLWIKSLLEKLEFYILPCLNPDGYHKTWELRNDTNAQWQVMRKNANGVDINRNFPLPGKRTANIPIAGSNDPNHERYTGPYPYSETETQAIRDFVNKHSFFVSIDFHSNAGTFFPPKCNSIKCEKKFRKMMSAANEKQSQYKYPTIAAWQVDTFTGEMEDTMFYDFGIMAVCWEIFPEKYAREQNKPSKHHFWTMNPVDINKWAANDRDAALAAIEKAYELTDGVPSPIKIIQK